MGAIVIREDFYDYFRGHNEVRTTTFSNLIDGWNRYKEMRKHIHDYGDAFYDVSIHTLKDIRQDKPQRPHARESWQWDWLVMQMQEEAEAKREAEARRAANEFHLDPVEQDFLIDLINQSQSFNTEDEDVMI